MVLNTNWETPAGSFVSMALAESLIKIEFFSSNLIIKGCRTCVSL